MDIPSNKPEGLAEEQWNIWYLLSLTFCRQERSAKKIYPY